MQMARKRKLAWGVALGLLACLPLAFWLSGGCRTGPFLSVDDLPPAEEFRSGDILLLGGASWRGRVVERVSHARFGHVGLVDVDGDVVWLLHASPAMERVSREPLAWYLASNRVACAELLRVDAPPATADAATEFAADAAARGVPFDHDFAMGPETGIYCSELVLDAWASAGVDLLPGHPRGDVIYPVTFVSSPRCSARFFALPATPGGKGGDEHCQE